MNDDDTRNRDQVGNSTYERYCGELRQEDKLLSDRVNWLLLSQSILFAAFGLAGDGAVGIAERMASVVQIVGAVLSAAIWVSALAAVLSSWRFRKLLSRAYPEDPPDLSHPQLLRSKLILVFGYTGPIVLPVVFIVAWMVLR